MLVSLKHDLQQFGSSSNIYARHRPFGCHNGSGSFCNVDGDLILPTTTGPGDLFDTHTSVLLNSQRPPSSIMASTDVSQTHPYTCNSCMVAFRESDAQRTHMRSDWHKYNLKRRVAELPPVSADDFKAKLEAVQESNTRAADAASFSQTCQICHKAYYSRNAYDNHMQSKAHKLREQAVQRGETASINGSMASKTDSHVSEEPTDPEAEAEIKQITAGFKKAKLAEQPLSPIQRRPSNPSPGEKGPVEHPLSPEKPADPLARCLFCNYDSPTWNLSVTHMTRIHGLFVPEQQYITDLRGLLIYLQRKIQENYECLWCHKLKGSAAAAQTHMRDKSHCRIAFETEEEMIEVGQFYDFSSTYSDAEEDSDTEMDEPKTSKGGVKVNGEAEDEGWETDSSCSSMDSDEITSVPIDDRTESYGRLHLHRHHSQTDPRPHKNADGYHSHAHHHNNAVFYDEYEMHLPSGRVAGHRSLKKYYRQNLHIYPTAAERTARAQRLLEEGSGDEEMEDVDGPTPATPPRSQALTRRGEAGMLGATAAQKKEVRDAEIRSRQKEQRDQRRYQAKIEKQANSQKHFRVSLKIVTKSEIVLTCIIGSATSVSDP